MNLVGCDVVVTNEAGERLRANITSERWPLEPGIGPDFEGGTQDAPADKGWAFWNAMEGGMRLTVECDGYETQQVVSVAPRQFRVTMKRIGPPPSTLGKLTIDGKFFRQGGERQTLIESSDFSLFQRYLDGENIAPILEQRRSLGFNCLRVWLLNESVVAWRNGAKQQGIDPRRHADFYVRLRAFCELLGAYGLNADLTVFTQTQTLMPNRVEQQHHLDASCDAVRGLGTVIVSRVNEDDQHDNAVDPAVTPTDKAGIIYSSGSNGSDSIPPTGGDCTEYHIIGSEWQRKTGHNAMEWADARGIPCWTSEAQRAPDNDSDGKHFYDAAAGGALLCAGTCFHSVAGKFSRLFDGAEIVCAMSHCDGAKSVPLEFQAGRYIHHDDLETSGIIRAYERRLGDGLGHIVTIRS